MFGINLCADGDTSAYWALVDQVATLETEPKMRALDYSPHITLAKYPTIEHSLLQRTCAALSNLPACTLRFTRIAMFPGVPNIVWLAPEPHAVLIAAHRLVHQTIDPVLCLPNYRPDQWTPHCTIALDIAPPHFDAAQAMTRIAIAPMTMTFSSVECVETLPLRILHSAALHVP